MQIDERDIAALEEIDQMVNEEVDAYLRRKPRTTRIMMEQAELSFDQLRSEMIKRIRERQHSRYWGFR